MIKTKVKFGIDLGTTNSSICSIDEGKAVIYQTDSKKETMPSCVAFINKKQTAVGDTAYNFLRDERSRATKNWKNAQNSFIEFKRTMGLDKKYHSQNAKKDFTSEELSAEVLKQLKSLTKENFSAVVVTVPAKFKSDQIAATRRAAVLAGMPQCTLLQEPVAAAIAYGVNTSNKDANWIVFDFGGGTFDVALLKVEDGIIVVKDTDGDNYLGGKNIDYAIIEEIFLPYLKEHYQIDSILKDPAKLSVLQDALKYYAETAKIALSDNNSYHLVSALDEFGEDDKGNSIELDLVLDSKMLKSVSDPLYKKAINLTLNLISRNNLTCESIDDLILVGGPTLSPLFREALKSEITPNLRTDVSPLTAVSVGAAMYAQTVDTEIEEVTAENVVSLNLVYESTTVADSEFVAISYLKSPFVTKLLDKQNEQLFIEITSSHWSSGKTPCESDGNVFEIPLVKNLSNDFAITLTDDKGNIIDSYPNHFSIIQGSKFSNAVLPYSYGIEVYNTTWSANVFTPLKGLEKNQALPAEGFIDNLNVLQGIKAKDKKSKLVIPIYQGEYDAADSNCIGSDHVFDVVLTGEDFSSNIDPASDISVALKVDESQFLTLVVNLKDSESNENIKIEKTIDVAKRQALSQKDLHEKVEQVFKELDLIEENIGFNESEYQDYQKIFSDFEKRIDKEGNTDEGRMILINDIRRTYLKIDKFRKDHAVEYLTSVANDLISYYESLMSMGIPNADEMKKEISKFKRKINAAQKAEDFEALKDIYDDLHEVLPKLSPEASIVQFINILNECFDSFQWRNRAVARSLVSDLNQKLLTNKSLSQPLMIELMTKLKDLIENNLVVSEKLVKH
jgi:molecular chaperone DnaK